MNRNILVVLTAAWFLAACGQKSEAPAPTAAPAATAAPAVPAPSKEDVYQEQAKSAVLAILKDPGSAQFQDLVGGDMSGDYSICGKVNAKNAMGGYVGFQKFCWTQNKGLLPGSLETLR